MDDCVSKWRENVMNKAVRLEEMESNMKNKVRGRGGELKNM